MLRAVLLGLLAVSSACSKSSTETSAKATPGAAAGNVLEAKGSVSVKQGGTTRPLAAGETVLADDVVITGADGNVVIELAHNSARWELGPNKQTKVSESIAWKAKKATAEEIDEATAAAGRPAERSAAGTVATAEEEAAPTAKAEMAPEAAMAPAAAAPAPEADMSPKGGAPARPARRAVAKAAPPPPPADIAEDEAPGPRRTRGGATRKTESAAAASQDSLSGAAGAGVGISGAGAGGGGIAPGGGGGTRGGGSVGGGGFERGSVGAAAGTETVSPSAASLLAAKSTALHACMVDHGAKDDVTLTVDVVSGKATVKLVSKTAISAALDKCLKGVVSAIHFTGSAKATRVVKP